MPDIRPDHPELELSENTSEGARWAASDALLDLVAADADDKTYILAQHFDAFAKREVEKCAAIADKEADLLLFTGARFRSFHTPGPQYFSDADLHEQAGTVLRDIAVRIRALCDGERRGS